MRKIISFFILLGLIIPFLPISVKADASLPNIDVTVTYIFDEVESNNVQANMLNQVYGSTITPTPVVRAGYTFVYWIVNGIVRADLPENNTFFVTSALHLVGLYSPDEANAVLFMDSNGKILFNEWVADGLSATPPTNNLPDKPGMIISTPAWMNVGTLSNDLTITDDSVYVLQYTRTSANPYLLTVNGAPAGSYNHNDVATVIAAPTDGPIPFSHWQENGIVISRSLSYSFTMLGNRDIEKVYLVTPQENEALVTTSQDLGLRDGYHTYLGQFYIPMGYEVVEYGFLIHDDNTLDLDLDTPGVTIAKANSLNPLTNEFMISFAVGSHMNARAYLVYRNGVTVVDVYSDTINRYYSWTVDDFSEYPETGSSYASGSFVGNDTNITWNYTRARGDKSIDGKSITLEGSTGILEATIPDGISSFKIELQKAFSSDTGLKLYINNNLIATSEKSTGDIVTFEIHNINISGTFTLKLVGDAKQTIIDNLSWVPYGPATGFTPIIENTSDATITEGDSYNPLTGVTASDVEDGDLTSSISYIVKDHLDSIVAAPVDFSTLLFGDYTITYSVIDSNSNTTEIITNLTILEAVNYTVNFEEDGGSEVVNQSVANGQSAVEPADPTKTNFDFGGWFTEIELTNLYDFDTLLSSDIDLYAKWIDPTTVVYSTDLFISEYIEGSGTTRAIELYNNTGSTVNLEIYTIRQYNNGSSTVSYELTLPDFDLLQGQTYVIYHSSSVAAVVTAAQTADGYLGTTVTAMNFNGDDAVSLAKSGTNIDVIGKIGVDPGSAWTATGLSTSNMTLVRVSSVTDGDSDGSDDFDLSVEWLGYPTDNSEYLGSHTVGE